mmetsp:Transcript_33294/g.79842  ORF Transcript_33294/g.79842 Transcript_33294/m.79842 type:complete len:240 (-) Transcript_33294:907-1626(-)
MPSLIIFCMEGSQSTGEVSCFFSRSTTTLGSVPGFRGSPVAFMYTLCFSGCMRGSISSNASPSLALAGAISEVWKPPEVFSTFACSAPLESANSFSFRMAASVPAQEKPLGNSSLAIWQTAWPPSALRASSQRAVNFSFSKPATESIACFPTEAASCMACPRSATSFRPSSKVKAPAAQRAVYSPSDKPAAAWKRVPCSEFSPFSFSTAANPAKNIAGWQYLVSSNLASGPVRQRSSRS